MGRAVELTETTDVVDNQCPYCASPVRHADFFCGSCGRELAIENEPVEPREDIFAQVAPALIFYFANLLLFAIYKLTPLFGEDFDGLLAVSFIDMLMVAGFGAYYWKTLWPLYALRRIRIDILLITIGAAVAAAFGVNVVADFINISLFDEVSESTQFTGLENPFLWSVLMTCIQPAVFEEVTFRGFLYNNIREVTSTTGAILISSFMFGFLHLAFISLLWLVPLGLAAAWLRARYNTLWYGMVAHFCYNFTIVVIEYI